MIATVEQSRLIMAAFSGMVERTYRDFQMGFRGPSHCWPPFTAKAIDIFLDAATFTPTLGEGVPVLVPLITKTIAAGAWRGVITGIGMSAESESAWADLRWDITINGIPQAPYAGIRGQLGFMSRPAQIFLPFQSRNVVGIQVTNMNAAFGHFVQARLTGWLYQVRSECGDAIESTIVD